MANLSEFNHAQRERLAFIEFNLQFMGKLARADLVNHFQIGLASCSRDLTLYRELAPHNMVLKHETKQYFRTEKFKPIFEHHPETILSSLCRGFGDGLSQSISPSIQCIDGIRVIHPNSVVIATLMRAINNCHAVSCNYISSSVGESSRIIVPHSLANNGQNWYVRAYDEKSKKFSDFTCKRLENITEIEQTIGVSQAGLLDKKWNNIINIELVVHPSVRHPKAVELDFDMINGLLQLEIREALLSHLIRHWNVDCSLDANRQSNNSRLWLKNIDDLSDIDCLKVSPENEGSE